MEGWISEYTGSIQLPKSTIVYTGKHFYLPKSTEKTYARRGLYALLITILCVLDNKDVYIDIDIDIHRHRNFI